MAALFWLAVVASLFGTHVLVYVAGVKSGEADARDALIEALRVLREQHEANDRRMRGA